MGRVRILSPALASQIAAGEVVERPASALKELVENALDAGATRCDVAIEGGGIGLLRVRDDGTGMVREDARLALERHATSKLTTFEDLDAVQSFGFRGEALPSIASVSRFTLRTRAAQDSEGTELVVEGGAEPKVSTVGMPVGTEVVLRDLFYNVPARRKFLKSSATEAGHIADVLENAALASPDVTFTLERDGRRAREWLRSESRAERVALCLGDDEFVRCVGERGPLMVEAYLGRPERARSGAAGLKLFCNNRPIRDRALLTTIAQSFGSVLERGRYPRGVVYLDLPPELVDVNVHPQKSEVRFADARAVTDAVYQLVSAELQKTLSAPSGGGAVAARPAPLPPPARKGHAPLASAPARQAAALPEGSRPKGEPPQRSFFRVSDVAPRPSAPEPESRPTREANTSGMRWSKLRFIAQLRGTYLVCEGEDALYIIDQHAAAERVTFHRLREQYRSSSLVSQSLLFPLTLELRPEQVELLEAKAAEVKQFGFEVRAHSERTVSLHAVPQLLQRASPERLLFDLLGEIGRAGRAFSDAVDLVLSTMACHGSVRSGDVLSPKEASALLQALDEVDFAGYCPHGRPIVASTTWNELERRVGRR